jgi:hypothetical protein
VAFLHPAGAFGTLIELVQEGAETRAKTRAKTRSETP